jgi:hypothetical protein
VDAGIATRCAQARAPGRHVVGAAVLTALLRTASSALRRSGIGLALVPVGGPTHNSRAVFVTPSIDVSPCAAKGCRSLPRSTGPVDFSKPAVFPLFFRTQNLVTW